MASAPHRGSKARGCGSGAGRSQGLGGGVERKLNHRSRDRARDYFSGAGTEDRPEACRSKTKGQTMDRQAREELAHSPLSVAMRKRSAPPPPPPLPHKLVPHSC